MFTVVVVRAGAQHVFESVRVKGLEWICTVAAFLFGYALAQPESTFAMSSSYTVLAAVVHWARLTEDQVGWSIMILALLRLGVLAYNGLWTSSPIARRWMSLAYTILWSSMFVGFWSANGFASAGTGFVLTFLLGEMVNTARTSGEVGRLPTMQHGRRVDEPHSGH